MPFDTSQVAVAATLLEYQTPCFASAWPHSFFRSLEYHQQTIRSNSSSSTKQAITSGKYLNLLSAII